METADEPSMANGEPGGVGGRGKSSIRDTLLHCSLCGCDLEMSWMTADGRFGPSEWTVTMEGTKYNIVLLSCLSLAVMVVRMLFCFLFSSLLPLLLYNYQRARHYSEPQLVQKATRKVS